MNKENLQGADSEATPIAENILVTPAQPDIIRPTSQPIPTLPRQDEGTLSQAVVDPPIPPIQSPVVVSAGFKEENMPPENTVMQTAAFSKDTIANKKIISPKSVLILFILSIIVRLFYYGFGLAGGLIFYESSNTTLPTIFVMVPTVAVLYFGAKWLLSLSVVGSISFSLIMMTLHTFGFLRVYIGYDVKKLLSGESNTAYIVLTQIATVLAVWLTMISIYSVVVYFGQGQKKKAIMMIGTSVLLLVTLSVYHYYAVVRPINEILNSGFFENF